MTGVLTTLTAERASLAPASPLPILWRDPHTVDPEELHGIIAELEQACIDQPSSADLRTCLGMAHAMNYDAYRSLDALEEARSIDPVNFWAQYKFSELHYRLRALPFAEKETLKALNLATNGMEATLARKQLQEIRRLIREGTQKPEWSKPMGGAAAWSGLAIAALLAISAVLR
jgi:hypothetical protein